MANPIPAPGDVVLAAGGATTYFKVGEQTPDVILTTAEAAAFLKIERQTARRWRAKGSGPRYFRLGGRKGPARYRLSDLLKWADSRSASSTSEESVRRNAAHDDALEAAATRTDRHTPVSGETKRPGGQARDRATTGHR